MLKKDRTAIVVSGIYSLFAIGIGLSANKSAAILIVTFISPVLIYWGYRFIQGDIDFKKND